MPVSFCLSIVHWLIIACDCLSVHVCVGVHALARTYTRVCVCVCVPVRACLSVCTLASLTVCLPVQLSIQADDLPLVKKPAVLGSLAAKKGSITTV